MAKKIERASMTQTDAKGKITRPPRDDESSTPVNFKWWMLEGAEMANAIAQTLKFIRNHQGDRREDLNDWTRLRGNATALGSQGSKKVTTQNNMSSSRLTFNLCSSVIDTLSSKMSKNKVIPTYITNGGIWKAQKKAKQLTKFTQGLAYEQKVHSKAIEMFDDAATWGDGFVHIFPKDDRVTIERTVPYELFVDIIEAGVSEPRNLYRVKDMDRDIALELFPELEENIMTVANSSYEEIGASATSADLITVVEAWHLPTSRGAGDGVHAITIGDGALHDEYTKDYFPFAHYRYMKRKIGWYGQGACERLDPIQRDITKTLISIQRAHHMGGTFKISIPYGNKSVPEHFNNETGSIWFYDGNLPPPQYLLPPIVQPELYQWVGTQIERGYDQEGVSKLSTTGEAPMGVDSGKAMRTLDQIGDDRFLWQGQEMEAVQLEIYRQAIEVAKDIYKDKGEYKVIFPNTRFMETIDWKDIQLDEDQYVLKAYPTSSLSDDLSGRLSDIQELMQAGLVSPRTGKRLMDMPDVEMNDNLSNAAEDALHKIFEDMLDDGKFNAPEPFMDLSLAKQLVLEYWNYASYMGAPQDRLGLLEQFNAQLTDMTTQAAQAMAPQPGGAPMAAPQPTPQSNLIPNTAGAA